MPDGRVLVIGTTVDYIEAICTRYPGRALFATDTHEREHSALPPVDAAAEFTCDITRPAEVLSALRAHCDKWKIRVRGITAFDCEALEATAIVAENLKLPFAGRAAVQRCRSKYMTKMAWRRHDVRCPRTAMIGQEIDVLRIASRVGRSVVLKPVVGSGSELTFKCNSPLEVLAAYKQVKRGLTANVEVGPLAQRAKSPADCVVVIEEYIDGREYSCDFALEDNRAEIIRVARKIFAPYLPFGATLGYIVPAELPRGISQTELGRQMLQAARALGLERALCMVDFVMRDGRPVFLELSPRPGGDCLPPLIKRSCGLDMLGLALDFAEGSPLHIPEAKAWRRLVGCRLFAAHGGKISKLDCARLVDDPRVIECRLRFSVGHEVKLPPQDYTSWLLGHVIFSSPAHHHVEQECREISAKLIVETGLYHDEKFPEIHSQTHRPSQASGTAA